MGFKFSQVRHIRVRNGKAFTAGTRFMASKGTQLVHGALVQGRLVVKFVGHRVKQMQFTSSPGLGALRFARVKTKIHMAGFSGVKSPMKTASGKWIMRRRSLPIAASFGIQGGKKLGHTGSMKVARMELVSVLRYARRAR